MPKNTKTKTTKKRTQTQEMPKTAQELTADEAKKVKGGIGMLIPAVQKVRQAAVTSIDVETKKLE